MRSAADGGEAMAGGVSPGNTHAALPPSATAASRRIRPADRRFAIKNASPWAQRDQTDKAYVANSS
jgi:hypothetical protein